MPTPRLALTVLAASLIGGTGQGAEPQPKLYVDCRGAPSASPTVILEAGAFGGAADWDLVLDDLAKGGRVCAYDRGGTGRSPPRAGGEDVASVARELAATLDGLGETGPVILVGHSNGALYAETFAAMWPERVAGLVYVNGVGDDDADDPVLVGELKRERRLSDLAVALARLDLAPAVAQMVTGPSGLPAEAAARKRAALSDPSSLRAARDEDRAIIPGLAVARALGGSPPQIPTVAIFGGPDPDSPTYRRWRLAEAAPAKRARAGWVLEAVGATHTSFLGRDRAYVTAAVDWLRSIAQANGQHKDDNHD